ncbi:uroporphyrinogen-III C-methyltransferase [Azovibrio restrictus]|uniref:uroporphyrinogen-III C-methyltransferase n=1 Tax=Azovibrio restrictus TaxID=146938 RepID=UPI0026EDF6BC|nr:uroporphyrinogen-III C-methyltransferase [Azovibrio restrictus]
MSKVYLIGAGPGAGDLLTLRAARILADEAEVVLADELVSAEVLSLVRSQARILKVGKRGGKASTPQAFIERLMLRYARQGRTVVRLKGGDPFMFGRGGEELLTLRAAGFEAEVVSGLTAGIAVPATLGIPVTHRGLAAGVTFVTARAGTQGSPEPDWAALAKTGTTLVIYMGLARLGEITRELLAAGLAPHTPAAVIAQGCQPEQQQVITTLVELPEAAGLPAPAIIVIGAVVSLAQADRLSGLAGLTSLDNPLRHAA